jgi:DNA repair protein RadD
MTVILRPYQFELRSAVFNAWASGARNVVMVLSTGGGKTNLFANIVESHNGASCVIAHRHEIVSQISLALAKCGVRHNVIAAKSTRDTIVSLHLAATGRVYYDPLAPVAVASVDTLVRATGLEAWAAQVTLWVVDEGHHLVEDNKWHRAISLFTNPHVRGLLPTATPRRADGKGLGTPEIGGDGVADAMVEGPPMRWLIDEGYLCDYRIICADSHIEELLGEVGKSGDWSTAQLKAADEQSPIVGNVVSTYRQWAPGQTGIVFASSVETAEKMLTAYRMAGVRAELVTGETDPTVRRHVFASLERGTVEVVLCVDIVSEGTDIPALQVGTFARATASLAVYMQQMGRLLRPLPTAAYLAARDRAERLAAIAASAKPMALVIDHVGNFMRHGPPDRPRQWQLARHGRRSNGPSDAIPMRACLNPVCCQPYERFRCECPYCGTLAPPPANRASPAEVEGDMVMLDLAVLAALRGEADKAVMSIDDYRGQLAAAGLPQRYILHNAKSFADKQDMQRALRGIMGQWGGYHHAAGRTDREIQRIFWQRFGIDVMTAQTLGPAEASELMTRVLDDSVKLI